MLATLLIAPVWNRNSAYRDLRGLAVDIASNRTSLESKLATVLDRGAPHTTSNRTSLESKLIKSSRRNSDLTFF